MACPFAASLNAQTLDKKWGIGFGLGAYGTLLTNGGIDLMPEMYLGRYLSPRLDIVLKGDVGLFNSNLVNDLDLVNPFLNLKFKLPNESAKLRSYVFAGPGYLYNNSDMNGVSDMKDKCPVSSMAILCPNPADVTLNFVPDSSIANV